MKEQQKQKITRIPIGLYTKLYQAGGDKLVSVFCMLKSQRNGEIKYYAHKSKNNKFVGGYSLLRKQTTLSLSVLEKYIPLLIEEDVCYFDKNGDFILFGNRKLKSIYGYKLVPIITKEKLTQTAVYSMSVRAFSKEFEQLCMIDKKQHRSEIVLQGENPRSNKELQAAKHWKKFYDDRPHLDPVAFDKVVLSNNGWAKLQNGVKDSKSRGFYHKKKLQKAGLIEVKRRFDKVRKMSKQEYKSFKSNAEYWERNRFLYINGYLVEEKAAQFSTVDLTKPVVKQSFKEVYVPKEERVKPQKHLTFDFIEWLQVNKPIRVPLQ